MSDVSNGGNGWTLSELRRAVIRIEKELDKKVTHIEKLIETHEERHVSLNRMLLIVFLTALFNVSGILIQNFLK